jgi:hypothetical protein
MCISYRKNVILHIVATYSLIMSASFQKRSSSWNIVIWGYACSSRYLQGEEETFSVYIVTCQPLFGLRGGVLGTGR